MRWNRSVNTGTLTWRQTAGVSLVEWSSSCAAINRQVTGPIQFLSSEHLPGAWSYHLSPVLRFKINGHLKSPFLEIWPHVNTPKMEAASSFKVSEIHQFTHHIHGDLPSSPAPLWKPQISQVKFFLPCLHAPILWHTNVTLHFNNTGVCLMCLS